MANRWDKVVGTHAYVSNLSRIKKIAEQGGHVLNPDKERIHKVIGLMTMNHNEFGRYYCPCKQSHPLDPHKDLLCPCDALQAEIAKDGYCFCKLFFSKK